MEISVKKKATSVFYSVKFLLSAIKARGVALKEQGPPTPRSTEERCAQADQRLDVPADDAREEP